MNEKIAAIETSIWIYWRFCALAMLLIISNKKFVDRLLDPGFNSSQKKQSYQFFLLVSWILTAIAAIGYILFTRKYEPGYYNLLDLVIFALANGILEQFMSIFWFLVGCFLAGFFAGNSSKLIFIFGYVSYALFSGAIRALFWTKVLPYHEPSGIIMLLTFPIMSLAWMWLFWRYRAIIPIISMHVILDFLTIAHLHFSWFE